MEIAKQGTFWRGEAGYEEARLGHMWNRRVPNRYPDVVVQTQNDQDVIFAVRLARQRGLKVAVRSGGHSWAAAFLRDGGMLIDVSRMRAFSVDAVARTASLQPGLLGTELNRALRKHDLFFPSGHCMTVGLGGFLLQGGFGWNSRLWGPACVSVTGVDVVTADGELVHADANQNADLYWAARGAGPGFFGVVTCFDVRLQPRPKVMMRSDYLYPIDVFDDVLTWALSVQPSLAERWNAWCSCAATSSAIRGRVCWLQGRFSPTAEKKPWRHWPCLRHVRCSARPQSARSISSQNWMLWGPPQPLADMAFSMQDNLYIALYSVWESEAEDAAHQAWVTDHMRELEPLASGIQLADENLGARPFRFLADENFRRLQIIRSKRDPNGMFHSYMGQPSN
jgi:FAD/FMN-containing dehydrogenase